MLRTVNPAGNGEFMLAAKADGRNEKLKVIACATVIEEMLPYLADDTDYDVLDFGLHLKPSELRQVLQEKIDTISKDADVVLLGYGLCAMAVVGLKAPKATLVIPRMDDCIALFLGSSEEYKNQVQKAPGTYYLTKGWIEVGDSPFEEHKKLVEKYGEEKAAQMTHMLLKNYTRLAFINTGDLNLAYYQNYSKKTARKFDLRYEEIEGSPSLVKKMINGPWDEDFVIVQPGHTLMYEDFINSKS
ncbi:MAG: DUF1638 domain-containing protein [Chloroflexota bacterium]|nr:DUF1638 domain-containing protein [Chloroflexota bacterium]